MLRMEIALFLVLVLVAYMYFSTQRRHTDPTKPFLCC